MCPDCGRAKMRFDTEREAQTFIKYNGNSCGRTLRVYYCPACCAYHLSSSPKKNVRISQTERLISTYNDSVSAQEYIDKISIRKVKSRYEINAALDRCMGM